jgi:methylase of polypeptide subunit release factors
MLRFGVKILLLPLVAGVSYEILKLLSKTKSKFFYIFKAPGLLLQRITTREPDDDMIEVAITAFNKVLEMDADETIEVVKFDVFGSTSTLLKKVSSILEKGKCYEACDAEWIVARVCNISRSEVNGTNSVTKEQNDLAVNYAKERAKGVPLQYVFGDTDFYGYTFKVNENVLIPRPETEELVMHALKFVDEKSSVLDMCTGSGAIAVTVSLKANVCVDAVDVSELALGVAKENANTLGAKVNFIQSNAF